MGMIGGSVGYRILRAISPGEPSHMRGTAYTGRSKLQDLLGNSIWDEIDEKVVVDFGCGKGAEAIELAQRGARFVYGVDLLERLLAIAREEAAKVKCQNIVFGAIPSEPADVIISIDAFEHFGDPAEILRTMAAMLKPGGRVLACFGPTWFHPYGGHLFSVFPWAHLIFSEQALCRWRVDIRKDGARKFSEVEGGLNQMTIRRFRRLVEDSPFRFERLETVPIRAARLFHNWMTQEFLTSVVRCKLSLPLAVDPSICQQPRERLGFPGIDLPISRALSGRRLG
jgi:SAM-dependent methyltransferase